MKRTSKGTFAERPERAAPIFDSKSGRIAAQKRWSEEKERERLDPTPARTIYKDLEFNKQNDWGYVYFLLAENGKIKIGSSKELNHRLLALQYANATKLDLLFAIIVPKYSRVENFLHKRFGDRRSHGEWFDITREEAVAAISTII